MATSSSYIISVADAARSASYYIDVLGFSPSTQTMGPGWRAVEFGPCLICIGESEQATTNGHSRVPASGNAAYQSWCGYLTVEDIRKHYESLAARGAEFSKDYTETADGNGADFSVRTVDGHYLMFGSANA